MDTGKHVPIPMKLLCLISDRDRKERPQEILTEQKAFFGLASLGKGTANSKILNYLGIGETDKTVFLTIMPAPAAKACLDALDREMQLSQPGHGIGFTCNIQQGCYHKIINLPMEDGGDTAMEEQQEYNLIWVILNRGYTEEVMDAARAAGATGGTVMHARGVGLKGAEKFFGITIQPEKEILLIVARAETGCAIMDSISQANGPGSDANAVSFSLPANDVRGLAAPREMPV